MWLFRRSSRTQEDDESDALREETEELRQKLEALRMAEYREAQRAACGKAPLPDAETGDAQAGGSRLDAASVGMSSLRNAERPCVREHGSSRKHDNDLEAMYDFSRFCASGRDPRLTADGHAQGCCEGQPEEVSIASPTKWRLDEDIADDDDDGCLSPEVARLRQVQSRLQEYHESLETRAAEKEKKLATASKALIKTKAQMRELTDQLGSKAQDGSKANSQADALQMLLAEKERKLQLALEEAVSVLENADPESPRQQPQVAPSQMAMAKEQNEEQLLELAAMTEELTDALETARDSEEDARKQLALTEMRLQEERAQRAAFERELVTVVHAQETEAASLRKRLQEQEANLALERARVKQLEARPKFFDFDIIKKDQTDFPSMDV